MSHDVNVSHTASQELITRLGKKYRTRPAVPQFVQAYKSQTGDYLVRCDDGSIEIMSAVEFENKFEVHITRTKKAKA